MAAICAGVGEGRYVQVGVALVGIAERYGVGG